MKIMEQNFRGVKILSSEAAGHVFKLRHVFKLPCPTILFLRASIEVWHAFKGRKLSQHEMYHYSVLFQLVKLTFNATSFVELFV